MPRPMGGSSETSLGLGYSKQLREQEGGLTIGLRRVFDLLAALGGLVLSASALCLQRHLNW
jgi:hypothetical protein